VGDGPKASLDGVRPYIVGLIEGLRRLGHHLGDSYTIDYRHAWYDHVKSGRAFQEAFHATGEPHELLYAMSTNVMQAAGNFMYAEAKAEKPMPPMPKIPIVFANCSDPDAEPLVKEGKATGFSARRSQTAHLCFDRFVATVPALKSVTVLHKAGYDPSDLALRLVTNERLNNHKNISIDVIDIYMTILRLFRNFRHCRRVGAREPSRGCSSFRSTCSSGQLQQ
jgi:hypothetical protein